MTAGFFLSDHRLDNATILKDATGHFLAGKKSLLLQDYRSAVSSLEQATRLFDQLYGVSADECGECYLQYGIALFELARQESGVLDGCVLPSTGMYLFLNLTMLLTSLCPGDESGSDDESEEENGEDEGEDGDDQKEDGAEKEADEKTDDVEDVEEDTAEPVTKPEDTGNQLPAASTATSAGSSSSSGADVNSNSEPVAGSSKEQAAGDEEEKEEEASDSDVAFEVLSLARDVFRRNVHKGPEYKLKLAEALQTLAEISLEWEDFTGASDLFQESLTLRKEVLPEEDRLIAESYYHIGVTFSFLNQLERANDCFRSAIQVIESKIAALKAVPGDANAREIAELQSLLPEMAAKIEDSREQMRDSVETAKAVADEESRESAAAAKVHDSPVKVVNDISHLVKRKRAVSPSENGNDSSDKKLCRNGGEADGNGSVC